MRGHLCCSNLRQVFLHAKNKGGKRHEACQVLLIKLSTDHLWFKKIQRGETAFGKSKGKYASFFPFSSCKDALLVPPARLEKPVSDGKGKRRTARATVGGQREPRPGESERVRGEGVTNGSFVLIRKKLVNLPTWAWGKREGRQAGLQSEKAGGRTALGDGGGGEEGRRGGGGKMEKEEEEGVSAEVRKLPVSVCYAPVYMFPEPRPKNHLLKTQCSFESFAKDLSKMNGERIAYRPPKT